MEWEFISKRLRFVFINQPSNFEVPIDPDAKDTVPTKARSVEIYIAIADENGNLLSEKRTTADLESVNRFV